MAAKLLSVEGEKVKVEVVFELKDSMLESEESIQHALNAAGCIGTEQALLRLDTDGSALLFGDQKWYSKGRQPKAYQGPHGEVVVERHVYQKSGGGKTFCRWSRPHASW